MVVAVTRRWGMGQVSPSREEPPSVGRHDEPLPVEVKFAEAFGGSGENFMVARGGKQVLRTIRMSAHDITGG